MLLISHGSTNQQITTLVDNDLVWRVAPSDAYQARIGAEYVYNVLGKKTAGILYSSTTWGVGLAQAFRESFEYLAGANTVISYVSYPELQDWSTYDFKPHLNELFTGQPEAIYIASYVHDGTEITHDMFLGGYLNDDYSPQFFSNDGPFGYDFILNGHPAILDGMMGTLPTAPLDDPNNSLFREKYSTRFGNAPITFTYHIYDAVYLIALAIQKAGSTQPAAIASALRAVSGAGTGANGTIINVNEFSKAKGIIASGGEINYEGASGAIDFDTNGDPGSGKYLIWKVVGGDYSTEAIVDYP